MLAYMAFRRWRLALLFAHFVHAQLDGGQFFTPGLAIISSPAPNSEFGVGSSLSTAISLSGQGKLTDLTPGGSNEGTGYDDLQIYLVSATSNINITVATNLLNTEPDSNVKHPEFTLPSCIPAGNYNLTLYERSRFKAVPLFVITQLPLRIKNSNQGAISCLAASSTNPVQSQPQADSPLDGSPWLLGQQGRVAGLSRATLASNDPQRQQFLGTNNLTSQALPNRGNDTFTPLFEINDITSTVLAQPTAAATRGPARSTFVIRTITITTDFAEATMAPFNAANNPQGILFPVNSGALESGLFRKEAWLLPLVSLFFFAL